MCLFSKIDYFLAEYPSLLVLICALINAIALIGIILYNGSQNRKLQKDISKKNSDLQKDSKMPILSFRFRDAKMEITDGLYRKIFSEYTDLHKKKPEEFPEIHKGEGIPIWSYRLINVGPGPAMNVVLKRIKKKPIQSIPNNIEKLYKEEIIPTDNIIGVSVNPEWEICYGTSLRDTNSLQRNETHLVVTYEDIFGRKYKTTFINTQHNTEKL